MGTNNTGQHRHDGQKNYQNSNQRNPDNIRNNTSKHHYENHDEETNDQNFPSQLNSLGDDMDFRDKEDNLEDLSD